MKDALPVKLLQYRHNVNQNKTQGNKKPDKVWMLEVMYYADAALATVVTKMLVMGLECVRSSYTLLEIN